MKKILMPLSAFVMMLIMGGNSVLDIVSVASAQEVSGASNMQDATVVESYRSRVLADSTRQNRGAEGSNTTLLIYLNTTDRDNPRIDSLYIASNRPTAEHADSLSLSAERPTEDAVPTKQYKNVTVKWGGRDRYGRFTDQCAAHVNGRLQKVGYYSQGHAYQIPYYYPSVINGYMNVKIPDLSQISAEKRFSAVLNMHRQASDYVKEHLDISKLVVGRYYVVNMYYTTSPYMLEFFYAAQKQGTRNYGTHVGVLYYSADAETWIVEHNIHGHVHYDALESILGGLSNPHKYGVTSISRVTR